MPDLASKRSLILALALPLVALGVMVARAETTSRQGRPWVVKIEGYDPRDLVRGHYLSFRPTWRWDEPKDTCADPSCCYCLHGPAGGEPLVTRIGCGETSTCDSWFPETKVEQLQKFFIPEDRGFTLEHALRAQDARLSIRVSGGGDVVIQDLLLDGKPWRDAVK